MLLSEAIKVTKQSSSGDVDVYIGEMDPEWCIGVVPNGGYALGQIVESCICKQRSSHHPDPIHVTAHFLSSPSASAFEVRVCLLKKGRSFTNLEADLIQNGSTRIKSHLIFGILEPPPQSPGIRGEQSNSISLLPPSPYARRLPLYQHPRTAPRTSVPLRLKFHSRLEFTREPELSAQNDVDSPHRTNAETVGGGGLQSGFWCGLSRDQTKGSEHKMVDTEAVTASGLPLFADISSGAVLLLPAEHRKGLGTRQVKKTLTPPVGHSLNINRLCSWFPTLTMTIEYKFAIPKRSSVHSNRTVGVFSSTSFLHGAMGRHNSYTEVWTAPCDIGEDVQIVEGWRDDQVCLAVSTQMAVTVPIEKNLAKGKGKL
ncbi:thioesterase-like superfamily-domain-containing protein [Lentinula raphanica]|nr:thioesterase-like superfamily-domain-containing protein [Lentinula raphanica]